MTDRIHHDLLRYVTTGVVCTGIDFSIYTLLTGYFGLHPAMANLISRPIGGTAGFLMHKYWTFQNRGKANLRAQFVRFWCVWFMTFTLSEGLVYGLHELFHPHPVVTKVLAESMCGVISFICQRHWTFSKHR